MRAALFSIVALTCCSSLAAQTTPKPAQSKSSSPSYMIQRTDDSKKKEQPINIKPPEPKKDVQMGPLNYLSPGIIGFKGGEWVGFDQLIDLGDQIGINIEIVKPASADFNLTQEQIRHWIKERFDKYGVTPEPNYKKYNAPLPTLHILIMIYPLDKQFVAYVSGRLLESVKLERTKLGEGVIFQAVTWERQNLIRASNKDTFSEIQRHILSIVDAFLGKYSYFNPPKGQPVPQNVPVSTPDSVFGS